MTTCSRLEELYVATLADRWGLACEVEAPGFLLVRVADRQCFVLLDPDDPGFLRLGTTHLLPAGTPLPSTTAAIERVNRRCPGVKATIAEDRDVLVFAAEMVVAADGCLPTSSHLTAVLGRMLDALIDAVAAFDDDLVLRALEGARV